MAIIDGKSVFYRGYYALPNLSTKEGIPTGGVYGFASMALELIKKLKPDYVAVAWDKPKTNIRARLKLYPQYKAGRKPAPPDFYTQIPILHELLEAFGWPMYELDDYEADDIMGSLAVQARKKNIETQLITSDLDALQLINGHVKVYALKRGFSNIEEFHPESFTAKYGLAPEQFLDLKALKGDSSDNIPGVPGVGEKTATALLQQYKTLDGVYKHLPLVKESLRTKLETGKKLAYLSKDLGQLWTDAPVKLDLKAMDVTKLDTNRLRQLLQDLEFRSLLNNLPDHMQVDSSKLKAESAKLLGLPRNTLIESDKDLSRLELKNKDRVFIYSRAAGKHGADPQALILSDAKKSFTLNLSKLNSKKVRKALSTVFGLPSTGLVGYDVKSDIKVLKNIGINVGNVAHDILIAAFLINPLMRVQSLTDLATVNLQFEGAPLEDLPPEDFIERAPEIIAVIAKLTHVQGHEFNEAPKLEKLAKQIEWPIIPVLADMELAGIKLDVNYLKKYAKQLEDDVSDVEQTIYGHADHEFNIASPGQLAEVLFTKLNLPTQGIKKGKTGYSTAASELDKLRGLHPVIGLITQYREMTKLKNTYVDTLPQMVDGQSRLHTTFNLTIAPTGRLSSADPNLQNIPVRTQLGKKVRTAFVAEKGKVLVSADYSQFEIRLAAALSGDGGMIEAFNRDADIHVETAALVYGIKPEQVTKEQRYSAKAVNFGIMYGLGPHGLSTGTGMDYGAAREFIAKYFEIRPQLKKYIDSLRAQAEEQGFVETIMGRRRPTPDVRSSNFAVREAAYRAAINHPLQGSAADLMKLAMIKIQQNFDQVTGNRLQVTEKPRMLLQIHDSILVECPEKQAKAVGEILKTTMENIYKLPVKLKVDISSGKNWGEL
ncbi:MAG: polymerase protein [Candidatus Saccharibacteria bacterium GW2011_GWA2_46_10]|nr:MAG: polymerase protein [Candidatus Saccharibacteria bacterium GW2011_GWA2_46_10]